MSYIRKDPDALDYVTIDWSRELDTSETIATVAWDVPAGLTNASGSETVTTATINLTGGTDGEVYEVGCRITTSVGRVLDKTIFIEVSPQ